VILKGGGGLGGGNEGGVGMSLPWAGGKERVTWKEPVKRGKRRTRQEENHRSHNGIEARWGALDVSMLERAPKFTESNNYQGSLG